MTGKYFIYIIKCKDHTYYIGKTNDIKKRLQQHNGVVAGGAKYTRGRRPVVLVYTEQYNSDSDAMKREIFLKKLTRKEKIELIHTKNYKATL